MKGQVVEQREVVIELSVLGRGDQPIALRAVIDTGFTGYLTLSQEIVQQLNLRLIGKRKATLGDGTVASLDVYRVRVMWHDSWQHILALRAEGGTLLGMSLLWNSRVTMDVVDGGEVTIEPMPER